AIAMSSGPGDLSRLYKTTNACRSWTLLFTNPDKTGFWDEIDLVAKRHKRNLSAGGPRGTIFILGDPVKSHFVIWEVHVPSKPRHLPKKLSLLPVAMRGETVFAASNSVMPHMTMAPAFGLPMGLAFATGGSHGSHWLRMTDDIGDGDDSPAWKSSGIPVGDGDGYIGSGTDSSGVFSVAFRYSPEQGIMRYFGPKMSYLVGIAVGGDYMQPNDITANAAYTSNGGQLWVPSGSTTQPHGYRSAVAYAAPTRTWITAGPNGTDISTDDGRNWHALKPDPNDPAQPPDADQHWNALSLPFVVGPHGRIGILSPTALNKP
ncbi:MAG: hypothetical protein HIU91_04365, partial [Acidobacteria bacterium]|nr:hypothetical protein [Acidobacteriota bacterium]